MRGSIFHLALSCLALIVIVGCRSVPETITDSTSRNRQRSDISESNSISLSRITSADLAKDSTSTQKLQLHPWTARMLVLSYTERQQLIKDGKLRDGMTPDEAEMILGPPTTKTDTYLDWYYNPGHRRHVAPFYRAKLKGGRLYKWKSSNR